MDVFDGKLLVYQKAASKAWEGGKLDTPIIWGTQPWASMVKGVT